MTLVRITLTYRLADEKTEIPAYLQQRLGVILHGLMLEDMAQRDPPFFESLHTSGHELRPYKLGWPQWNEELKELSWSWNSLSQSMTDYLQQWAEAPCQSLYSDQLSSNLILQNLSITEPLSYSQFARQYYGESIASPGELTLRFTSPSTFKWAANAHYYPYPDPRLLLQSSLSRWNSFAQAVSLDDPALADTLIKMLRIQKQSIWTVPVQMNKRGRIPAFKGWITLSFGGPPVMRQLTILTLQYLSWCGAGTKTTMGLGDVLVERTSDYKSERSMGKNEYEPSFN